MEHFNDCYHLHVHKCLIHLLGHYPSQTLLSFGFYQSYHIYDNIIRFMTFLRSKSIGTCRSQQQQPCHKSFSLKTPTVNTESVNGHF